MKHSPWPLVCALALSLYATGATFVEGFVNYPSWRIIGPAEFVAYHQFITPRVVVFLVVPIALSTIATALMLWWRPSSISRRLVWIVLVCHAVMWGSSITIQIPIQGHFSSTGFDEERLARLIVTNLWLRRLPGLIAVGVLLWMLQRVLVGGGHANASRPVVSNNPA